MTSQRNFFTWRLKICKLSEIGVPWPLLLLVAMIVDVTAVFPDAAQLLSVGDSPASIININELDSQIQKYAFQSFGHSGTGTIYTVSLPSNLTGLKAEAVRLRSGSLRRHGFSFNEFNIPLGASVNNPSPMRVLLIYREFAGLRIYAPRKYKLVAPVLGMKIYSAANLSTTDALPELHLTSLQAPVTVRIPLLSTVPGTTPFCASFDANGALSISNVTRPPNLCSFTHLGDFSLAIPAPPAPGSSASPLPQAPSMTGGATSKRRKNAWKIALGSAVGAFALLAMAGVIALVAKSIEKTRIAKMEIESERGEVLYTTPIGSHSRTPTAGIIRTRPSLEHDYSL